MSEDQKQPGSSTLAAAGVGFLGSLPGVIAALAGAGWPGVIALSLGGIATLLGLGYLVSRINKMIDARDSQNAGADAGETATNLANQAQENRTQLDELENIDPPTRPKS